MYTNLTPISLKEKISELKTALFYNLSSSVLKIPNSVINVLEADDMGQLWFCMQPPVKCVTELEDDFLSELQLYQKGKSFYLKITGKTFIVSDPEEINNCGWISNDIKGKVFAGTLIMLKVKIQYANYFETAEQVQKKQLKDIFNNIYTRIFEPSYNEAFRPLQSA